MGSSRSEISGGGHKLSDILELIQCEGELEFADALDHLLESDGEAATSRDS